MNTYLLKLFIIAFFAFVITDAIWIGLIAKSIYFKHYAQWLRLDKGQLKPIWWASFIVYFLFALSIVVFILPMAQHSYVKTTIYGALLGAIIYGVYDFTCIAIFKDFPILIGFIDWAWGIILCTWCSLATSFFSRY